MPFGARVAWPRRCRDIRVHARARHFPRFARGASGFYASQKERDAGTIGTFKTSTYNIVNGASPRNYDAEFTPA